MVLQTSQESCPFQTAQTRVWGGFGGCWLFGFFFPPQINDKIAQPVQLERAFSFFIFLHPEIMSVTNGWRIQQVGRSAEDSPQRNTNKNDVAEVEIHRYWEVKALLGKSSAVRVFKPLQEIRKGQGRNKEKMEITVQKVHQGSHLLCERKQEGLHWYFGSWGFKTSSWERLQIPQPWGVRTGQQGGLCHTPGSVMPEGWQHSVRGHKYLNYIYQQHASLSTAGRQWG